MNNQFYTAFITSSLLYTSLSLASKSMSLVEEDKYYAIDRHSSISSNQNNPKMVKININNQGYQTLSEDWQLNIQYGNAYTIRVNDVDASHSEIVSSVFDQEVEKKFVNWGEWAEDSFYF
ncbi:hypothetical protein [Photobacterium sp. DNB22_13_2]